VLIVLVYYIVQYFSNVSRNDSLIAVVATVVAELWAIELSEYFLVVSRFGAAISASNNRNPNDLRSPELLVGTYHRHQLYIRRSNYCLLYHRVRDSSIHISRLASGIPIGRELDYLDEGTHLLHLRAEGNFTD